MTYKNREEWNSARIADWKSKSPAPQKLTKELSQKGAKLYYVQTSYDDNDRVKSTLVTWLVTSLKKFSTGRYIGVYKKYRDVTLYVAHSEDKTCREAIRCDGEEGKESLSDEYFSTPKKALDFVTKYNAHRLHWIKTRPPTTPENEFMDNRFGFERLDRERVALSRLKKRLNK